MKAFFFASLAALLPLMELVNAQDNFLSSLPACSIQCFESNISLSSCSPTDIPCLCGDTALLGAVQTCQASSCTVKDILSSTNVTLNACGVPPGDQSTKLIAIPAAFGSTVIVLVIIRVISRVWSSNLKLEWDDYLILASAAFATVLNSLCLPMTFYGMGKDFWAIPHDDIDKVLMYLYLAMIPYMISEMLAQLSLLAFYLRVFGGSSNWVKRGSWVLICISASFGIANTFSMIFQCTPIPFFWKSWTGEMLGSCINIKLFSWARASIQIAMDASILSLPLPALLQLRMNKRKKLQLLVMFALGFTITVISILRLESLVQFAATQNPTLDNSPAVYWSVLECNMFIICACLPSLRAVLSRLAPKIFGWSTLDKSYEREGQYVAEDGVKDSVGPGSSYQLSNMGSLRKSNLTILPAERAESVDPLVHQQSFYG